MLWPPGAELAEAGPAPTLGGMSDSSAGGLCLGSVQSSPPLQYPGLVVPMFPLPAPQQVAKDVTYNSHVRPEVVTLGLLLFWPQNLAGGGF